MCCVVLILCVMEQTLQSVTLMYTLLTQGYEIGKPICRRIVVVTPTSLVGNWRNELTKWCGTRISAIGLSESNKEAVQCGIDDFLAPRSTIAVLIVSYDTFRRHAARFKNPTACDMLICDEAHRLKNDKTATYATLDALPCARRVLLSGTPLQNDLSEFFAMIHFVNRGVLGDRKMFRRYYETPVLAGREPDALPEEQALGRERSTELSAIVNQFVLRRTNVLLSQHLPPKVIEIVCCRPTELQIALYTHFINSKAVRRMLSSDGDGDGDGGKSARPQVLPLITALKKLCNHPKLIYDVMRAPPDPSRGAGAVAAHKAFDGCDAIFAKHRWPAASPELQSAAGHSGKMYVLEELLKSVRSQSRDRWVIVSNSTSALDVMASMCKRHNWATLRLDGSTTIKKRTELVNTLNTLTNNIYVFLLSSRAGGCGLNLVGANRLVLFDPDWNPAVDKQAAARVWRDGQTKRCFVYRFLTTGSIEEKVYQRQLSKEGLTGVLGGSASDSGISTEELKDLFRLRHFECENTPSDTHDTLDCACLRSMLQTSEEIDAQRNELQAKLQQQNEAAQRVAAEAARAAAEENGDELPPIVVADDSGSSSENSDPNTLAAVAPDGESYTALAVTEQSKPSGDDDEADVSEEPDSDDNAFIASDDDDDGGADSDAGSKKKGKKGGGGGGGKAAAAPKKRGKKDRIKLDRSGRLAAKLLDPLRVQTTSACLLGAAR